MNIANDELFKLLAHGNTDTLYGNLRHALYSSRLIAKQYTVYRTESYWVKNADKAREELLAYLQTLGFIVSVGVISTTAVNLDEKNDCYGTVFDFRIDDATMSIHGTGDKEAVDAMLVRMKEQHPTLGMIISTAISVNNQGRVSFDKKYISDSEIQKANQTFYPWMGVSLEQYFDAFMDSKESILVLFGPAGGGKSTFLRSLMAHRRSHSMLAFNKEVIESPSLLRQFYESSTAKILAYEDIDRHLSKRGDGNDFMAAFLNAAEGVVQHPGKKIVFSTNLTSIDRIDPALLRVGRCFDILKFSLMTAKQAHAARDSIGLLEVDFPDNKEYSLAEALVVSNVAQQTINRFGRKPGF